ncbi:MAG: HD domain-containing protein [Desulfomonile sp.]|nr:HD domain-containing protein [Desulfomonile sp.]
MGGNGFQPPVVPDPLDIHVPIYQLFGCLGEALDLVHPQLTDHHKSTAVIAALIADEMALPSEERANLILASLIHDAGAFGLKQRLDVARFDSEDILPHCTAGYQLLRGCPSLGAIAEIVRHHHVRWADCRDAPLQEVPIPRTSHLLHLADRVAVGIGHVSNPLSLGREIVKRIRDNTGKMLAPELVQIFEKVASRPAFWFDVTSHRIGSILDGLWRCSSDSCETVALSEIEHLFSRVIDFRSRFTASHSVAVAAIAEAIGQRMGLGDSCRSLRAAGHFHDLGKLSVPVEILEKPGPLTPEEISLIMVHPYHTFQVLRKVDQLNEITRWASCHHECLDGSGYPFCLAAEHIPMAARILAVADMFVALSEDRPYRPTLPRAEVIRILGYRAKNSKLDGSIVALVTHYFDELDARHRDVRKQLSASYGDFVRPLGLLSTRGTPPS